MFFSNNLNLILEHFSMNQVQLGKKFGISNRVLNSYLSGKARPKWEFLIELEKMTGITFSVIIQKKITKEELPMKPYSKSSIASEPEAIYERKETHTCLITGGECCIRNLDNLRLRIAELEKENNELKKKS